MKGDDRGNQNKIIACHNKQESEDTINKSNNKKLSKGEKKGAGELEKKYEGNNQHKKFLNNKRNFKINIADILEREAQLNTI